MPKDWDSTQPVILPKVPRLELKALQGLDTEARFHLTMYLRGAAPSDQDEARRRCLAAGVDYGEAMGELMDVEYRRNKER